MGAKGKLGVHVLKDEARVHRIVDTDLLAAGTRSPMRLSNACLFMHLPDHESVYVVDAELRPCDDAHALIGMVE